MSAFKFECAKGADDGTAATTNAPLLFELHGTFEENDGIGFAHGNAGSAKITLFDIEADFLFVHKAFNNIPF